MASDHSQAGVSQNIHHLGWVVASIEETLPKFTSSAGLADLGIEDHGWVRVAFLGVGCSLIELLEPQDAESDIREFLRAQGEGIHHVAYGVPDVAGALRSAAGRVLTLVDESPRPGARNTLIGFVDPGLPGGTLVEYVQDPQLNIALAHAQQPV
jgi:methylmalonyl-CoA/ethylmalonyl-CoA epimerase